MVKPPMENLSRDEWIARTFHAFVDGGVDALRVEPLAKRLGVTKGSFYHHFENRRALHLALAEEWERQGTSQIIEQVDQASEDPAARLRTLAHRSMRADEFSDAIETGMRSWAVNDDEVRAAVQRVDERRLDFTANLLREIGIPAPLAKRRARLFYRVLIGEFMWRSSGGPAMSAREIDEAVDQLIADAP